MFTVALVSLGDSEPSSEFETSNICQVELLKKEAPLAGLENVHGVIIQNSCLEKSDSLFELVVDIKNNFSVPIWIYSKKNSMTNKLINLKLGVLGDIDDSTSVTELLITISNTLKHIYKKNNNSNFSKVDNEKKETLFELVPTNNSLKIAEGEEIVLTRLEYQFTSLLLSKPNEVFTYQQIAEHVWDSEELHEQKIYRVTNLSFHLRLKLKHHNFNHKVIKTVRSRGYMVDLNLLQ